MGPCPFHGNVLGEENHALRPMDGVVLPTPVLPLVWKELIQMFFYLNPVCL